MKEKNNKSSAVLREIRKLLRNGVIQFDDGMELDTLIGRCQSKNVNIWSYRIKPRKKFVVVEIEARYSNPNNFFDDEMGITQFHLERK